MSIRNRLFTVLALALMLPLAACDSTDAEFGEVSILLTDAPEDEIAEAWVTFTEIYLQGGSEDGPDDAAGRVYLFGDDPADLPLEYELSSLAGEVASVVEGELVPTGSYGQLRIVVGDACIITEAGTVFATDGYGACGEPDGVVNLTSTGTSGWKVLLNGLHVDGDQEILLLDFLLDESFFKKPGTSNQWVLTPVIKGADVSLSGGFDITLSDPDGLLPEGRTLDEFSVTMAPEEGDEATLAFILDETLGAFLADFEFEMPGAYTFTLVSPEGLQVTVEPASPTVRELASGQIESIDWVITGVTETSP
jgi:hypothetical protein